MTAGAELPERSYAAAVWLRLVSSISRRRQAKREFNRLRLTTAQSREAWRYGRGLRDITVFYALGDVAQRQGIEAMMALVRAHVPPRFLFDGLIEGAPAANVSGYSLYVGTCWRTVDDAITLHEAGVTPNYAMSGRGLTARAIIAAHAAGVPATYLAAAARREVEPAELWTAGVPVEYLMAATV